MRTPSSTGKTPCCSKVGIKKGPWTPEEDEILTDFIKREGEGRWRTIPKRAGLLRCGKSCRLRWMNYLRPSVKRGRIAPDEEDLILRLHRLLGNRWSLIAGRIPGRTDNEIKNYWNTHLSKKLISQGIDPRTHKPLISSNSNPNEQKVVTDQVSIQNPNPDLDCQAGPNPSSIPLRGEGFYSVEVEAERSRDLNNYQAHDDKCSTKKEKYIDNGEEDMLSLLWDNILDEDIFEFQQQQQPMNAFGHTVHHLTPSALAFNGDGILEVDILPSVHNLYGGKSM